MAPQSPLPFPKDVKELSIMIDVTNENFIEQSNDFIQHLPNASWIALDEEMTGISLPNSKKLGKDESPAERYESLKAVPERYSIIQLGICLFETASVTTAVAPAKIHVRRYKFTLFPPADNSITREVTFNPSSIHFLAQNNMNFDRMVREGIPFVTKDTAIRLAEKFHEKQDRLAKEERERQALRPPTSSNHRRNVELTRIEDKNFHARSMASLREWLDAAIILPPPPPSTNNNHDNNNNDNVDNHDNDDDDNNNDNNDVSEGASFLLPPCNSFLRRALYETIPKEYPNLVLETTATSQIRVLRLNPMERTRRKNRLLRKEWKKFLVEKIGMYRIFLALSKACNGTLLELPESMAEQTILAPNVHDAMEFPMSKDYQSHRKIPLVVHNGLQDLLFMMTHFHASTLPDSWPECKKLLHSYFPMIYDTKVIALEYARSNPNDFSARSPPTHLAAIYERTLLKYPRWNRNFVVKGNDNTDTTSGGNNNITQAHDADYDAYMTGAAFHGLVRTIESNGVVRNPATVPLPAFAVWQNANTHDNGRAEQWFGRNKMYFHLSPYTIDLKTDDDPLGKGMSFHSTYKVTNIDESVSTREIVRCLAGLFDERGDRVDFEIIWVNDTTFLVAAMVVNARNKPVEIELFKKRGNILLQALSSTFSEATITCLIDTKGDSGSKDGQDSRKTSSMWNLWAYFGKKKRRSDDDGQRKVKRRRIS